MTWVRVESSVARNKKFVNAGAAASWLWLCGLAYCQEGLTDGFIPTEALPFLGVKNAVPLAKRLERVHLWDVADGGWMVHDYLRHNKAATEVERIKAARGAGGKLGGRPPNLPENLGGKPSRETLPETFPENPSQISSEQIRSSSATATDQPQSDVWLTEFLAAYPKQGICESYLCGTAFFAVVGTDRAKFDALLARLERHKNSLQWKTAKKVPRADRYLRDGLHLQELPEEGSANGDPRLPEWARAVQARQGK